MWSRNPQRTPSRASFSAPKWFWSQQGRPEHLGPGLIRGPLPLNVWHLGYGDAKAGLSVGSWVLYPCVASWAAWGGAAHSIGLISKREIHERNLAKSKHLKRKEPRDPFWPSFCSQIALFSMFVVYQQIARPSQIQEERNSVSPLSEREVYLHYRKMFGVHDWSSHLCKSSLL